MRLIKTKLLTALTALLTLMLCMGVFYVPVSASAEGMDEIPPEFADILNGILSQYIPADYLDDMRQDYPNGAAQDFLNDEITLIINSVYISGDTLFIGVTDANGVNSTFSLNLSDYVNAAENSEYISVQAVDINGNKSEIIKVRNPFYVPTAEPGPVPVTPEPTEPEPAELEPAQPTEPTEPIIIRPFTPDGEGTVIDNAGDYDGKEFFTVTSQSGAVYYLVIDRQRNTDNVYLLNAVTEQDLMAIAEKDGSTVISTSAIPQAPPEEKPSEPEPVPTEPEPDVITPPKKGGNNAGLMFILIAAAIALGAGYYFKIVKGKNNGGADDDYGYDGDSDDDDDADFGNDNDDNDDDNDNDDEDLKEDDF